MTADMPDAVKVAESFCDEKSIEDYKTRAGAILGARAMQDAMAGRVRECDLRSIDWRGLFISVLDRMRQGGESREMGARWMAEAASRAILSALEPAGAQEGAASPIAAMAATLQAVADEGVFAPDPLVQEGAGDQPPYPEGDVVGPCVCGSWPGGPCLKCEWRPATPAPDVPGLVERLRQEGQAVQAKELAGRLPGPDVSKEFMRMNELAASHMSYARAIRALAGEVG